MKGMITNLLLLAGFLLGFSLIFYLIKHFSKEELRLDIFISSLVIVIGLFIGNQLQTNRDLANARRERITEMRVKAFQGLTKAYNHSPLEVKEYIQSALIDIQLLGTPDQARKVELFVKKTMERKTIDWDAFDILVEDLRKDLRKELELPGIEGKVWWIRILENQEAANKANSADTKSRAAD